MILMINDFRHSDRRQLAGRNIGRHLCQQCVQQYGGSQMRRRGRRVACVRMFVDPLGLVGRMVEDDVTNRGNLKQ